MNTDQVATLRPAMKPQKVIIFTILGCASLVFSYWLGYSHGSKAKLTAETAAPLQAIINRASQPPQAARRGGQPAQPAARPDPLAHIAKRPFTFQPRDAAAKPELIDLTKWYNATLAASWHGPDAGNDFKSLPTGLQTLDGTQFDVRGLIQVRGQFTGSDLYPPQVNDIRIGMRCDKLAFLQNACRGGTHPANGTKIGAYVIHYADGDILPVPLLYRESLNCWWDTPTNAAPLPAATLAWKGANQSSSKNNAQIHLRKFTWKNPRPDVEIASLDLVGDGKIAAPFLIAITAEPVSEAGQPAAVSAQPPFNGSTR